METGLITKESALEFLNSARQNSLLISGVERLLICEDGHIPDLERILNLSTFANSNPPQAIEEAIKFLKGYGEVESQRFTIAYRIDRRSW